MTFFSNLLGSYIISPYSHTYISVVNFLFFYMCAFVVLSLLCAHVYSGRGKIVSSVRNDDMTKRHYTLHLKKFSGFIFVEAAVTTSE